MHNNLKNVVGLLDDVLDDVLGDVLGGITGIDLNFLSFDTSVGLDCADIDDDDTAEDGAICWDVVSCCENNAIVSSSHFSLLFESNQANFWSALQSSLGSVFVGCVPVV